MWACQRSLLTIHIKDQQNGSDFLCTRTRTVRGDDLHRSAGGFLMNQPNLLYRETERILTTLSPDHSKAVRRLLAPALDQVLKAVTEGTSISLASWASRQSNQADVNTALFAACTSVLRLIDSSHPSQFAAADRLLLSARHIIARGAATIAA